MDSTTTTAPKRVVFAPFHEVRLLPKQGISQTENEPGVPTVLAPNEPLNKERTGTKTPTQSVKTHMLIMKKRSIHVCSESVCDDAEVPKSSKFTMLFYTNTFRAKITPKPDTDTKLD